MVAEVCSAVVDLGNTSCAPPSPSTLKLNLVVFASLSQGNETSDESPSAEDSDEDNRGFKFFPVSDARSWTESRAKPSDIFFQTLSAGF